MVKNIFEALREYINALKAPHLTDGEMLKALSCSIGCLRPRSRFLLVEASLMMVPEAAVGKFNLELALNPGDHQRMTKKTRKSTRLVD